MRIEREVVSHPDASMRCTQLRLAAFRGGLHRHSHAELTWIESGRGLRWVGDRVEPFGDGDVVLLGAELPHLWLAPDTGAPQSCTATVVQFPVDWAAATGLPELRGMDRLMARAAHGLALEGSIRRDVQRLMARLASSDALRRAAALIETLATLSDALKQRKSRLRALSSHAPAPGPDAEAVVQRRQRVDRLLRWIQAHLAEELRVSDAAEIAGALLLVDHRHRLHPDRVVFVENACLARLAGCPGQPPLTPFWVGTANLQIASSSTVGQRVCRGNRHGPRRKVAARVGTYLRKTVERHPAVNPWGYRFGVCLGIPALDQWARRHSFEGTVRADEPRFEACPSLPARDPRRHRSGARLVITII